MVARIEYGQRWTDLLAFLERNDGRVQLDVPSFAAALGWPERSTQRHLLRMEQLKVIAVTRTGEYGRRYPNTYTLLMTMEQWEHDGSKLVREHRRRARLNAREREARVNKVPVAIGALPPASRAARTMAQIESEVVDTLHRAEASELAGDDDDIDVSAWGAGR